MRATNIAEQLGPFFTNLTTQFQNLISLVTLAPVPTVEEITVMPEEEIVISKENNTLRNVVIVSLIVVGGVLVSR